MPKLGPSAIESARKYELQRQNCFEVQLPVPAALGLSTAMETITLAAESTSLPTWTNEELTIPGGNRDFKIAGKMTFNSTNLTLKDFIEADTAGILAAWKKLIGDPETGRMAWAYQYKVNAKWIEYAPDGTMGRIWVLHGAWPQEVNFGTLELSTSDKKPVEVTLAYDWPERFSAGSDESALTAELDSAVSAIERL